MLFRSMREGVKDWDTLPHSKSRPHWDGGKDIKGVRHKCIWTLIASHIKSAGANPGVWVAAHFSPALTAVRLAKGKGLIATRPELLNSNFSGDVYSEHVSNFDDSFLRRFVSAESSLDTRFKILQAVSLPEDDRALLTLCDKTHVNASPFLRHAFASAMGCRRAVKKFAVQAAIDYEMEQPLYDDFITSHEEYEWLLTDELKKVVIWFRQHWSNYRG